MQNPGVGSIIEHLGHAEAAEVAERMIVPRRPVLTGTRMCKAGTSPQITQIRADAGERFSMKAVTLTGTWLEW